MSFAELVNKTLVEGGAYLTVLRGLLATVEISVLSILIGTLLGVLVCAMRMSRHGPLRLLSSFYITVMRGSPVLLLLMLMYYVVFAKTDLSANLIAISAFSLNVSAHVAECFRAAMTATDHMQVEAARTLGFSRWQAFVLISLPQAATIAKPTYQSTIVNLVQWTSVVGYVTITDLTRVINNIGSRTMQPLFMIVVGMLLYLGLAYVCYGVFALSELLSKRRLARRQRT